MKRAAGQGLHKPLRELTALASLPALSCVLRRFLPSTVLSLPALHRHLLSAEEPYLELAVPATINRYLRSYQREGIQFLFRCKGVCVRWVCACGGCGFRGEEGGGGCREAVCRSLAWLHGEGEAGEGQ